LQTWFRNAQIFAILFLVACGSSTRHALELASDQHDPAVIPLETAFNDYVRRAILEGGTETGIIKLADGSSARFWFRSHHLTGDLGGALFKCSDNSEIFISGYFCCEVQLPEKQLASLDELRAFLKEIDGAPP